MGTRSTIHFYDNQRNILNIYNQYDGYLSGIGRSIVDFFRGKDRGNGFDDDALMYVIQNKKGAYTMYATNERDVQEFNYYIYNHYNRFENKTELVFEVTQEVWIEERGEFAIVTLLRGGSLEDFEELIEKEEKKHA